MDVPLLLPYTSSSIEESIDEPGAMTSMSGPRLPEFVVVSSSLVRPTVNAVEMQPGAPTALRNELFPEAMTVAMPAARLLSIAALRLSPSQADELLPPPRLMLLATTFHAGFAAAWPRTQSSASIWSE